MTNENKVLAVTGHRPNKLGGFDTKTNELLNVFAANILKEHNPKHVITGMALGWDIAIAKACYQLGIQFTAAVPFREQDSKWTQEQKNDYNFALSKAYKIVYIDEIEGYEFTEVKPGKYHAQKMQLRNKWMVDNSDAILALWNATKGGTKNAVEYARNKYSFPKEQIVYLWEEYLEFRDNMGYPLVPDEIQVIDADVLPVDVVNELYNESSSNYLSREQEDLVATDLVDAIVKDLEKDLEPGEIVFPYQQNPDLDFSPYNAVCNDGKFIHVDEEYLEKNLNWKPDFDYSKCDWEPRRVVDYRLSKRVYLDIETMSLDPSVPENRIIMIGLKIEGNFLNNSKISERGYNVLSKGHILELEDDSDESERKILTGLFRLIAALNPDAIVTHNGFNFDFPYIIKRCEMLGVSHPMTRIEDKERSITAASVYGKPVYYYPVYWTKANRRGRVFNDGTFPQLVDTLHLAGQHDKIFANMSSYTLKYLAFYVGFRTEKRLELKGKEIGSYWKSGESDKRQQVRDYLIFDLEDQQAVTNFFMVSPWYQQMYFPLPLQEICVASPARKHNANLEKYYRKFYDRQIDLDDGSSKYYTRPEADEKVAYEGALVDCIPGVYKYFFSIDVSSLYPSLMLRYALMDKVKDPFGVFLKTIDTLRSLRYVYKALGQENVAKAIEQYAFKEFPYLFIGIDENTTIDKEDISIYGGVDKSLKVGINGGYGFEGVGFYNFNSLESAALVTAYGRIIITKMRKIVETYSTLITLDTDGIKGSPKKINEISADLLKDKYYDSKTGEEIPVDDGNGYVNPVWIWQAAQAVLPEGIEIDLEDNCPNGAVYAPAMKNYIYWEKPEKKPQLKGVYRKRNRSELQKEFPIEFIRKWAFEGQKTARRYGNEWIKTISGFEMLNKNILKRIVIQDPKKLKGEEKKLHKLLLESNCGEIGEDIIFYWGSRQHYAKSGRKNGVKPFPIRRYLDGRVPNNQEFPCDSKDVNKQPFIEKYVSEMNTPVIPYSPGVDLNELLDLELIRKLMFTSKIGAKDRRLTGAGMGEHGDNVTFFWASIQKRTPTGKISSKLERFPVRVIINDDDSISIDLQEIPPEIDTSLINLHYNIDWYIEDFLKIQNEILNVVDKK